MRSIRRDPDYLDDPMLLEYVQSVWQPLLAAARRQAQIDVDADQRFAWEPFLVRDRSVNAFALPGGYVGVHLGLIAVTETRDELAAVLAHELSHVTQRHIARGIDNSKHQSLVGMATMILGALALSRSAGGAPGAGEALIVGGQASSLQGTLNFSREMEREADRMGFSVLTGGGYAPQGMATMFEKLERASRLNDSGAFPYLRTHPLNAARIGEARSRMGPSQGVAPPPASRLEHALAQARARVLMDPRVESLRRWQSLDKDVGEKDVVERLAAAYSASLASTLLKEWSRADAALAKAASVSRVEAKRDARSERWLSMLRVESLADRGDWVAAAAALPSEANAPTRSVMLLSAQVAAGLLNAKLAKATADALATRAADDLQSWLANSALDAGAWSALAELWAPMGQRLRAVRAEAEAHYTLGDWDGAVDRLRAAQRLPRGDSSDFIELSVIDARLRSIEAQRRQLALENVR
jgi:predicted Zn-dependent protease